MNIEELNNSKTPVVRIDKKLDKLRGRVLFPEKLDLANKTLEKVGLPDNLKKKSN